MRILLIKPKQIGDSLILTPTITAIKRAHPEAEIWVVVRRGCEGILAGLPGHRAHFDRGGGGKKRPSARRPVDGTANDLANLHAQI